MALACRLITIATEASHEAALEAALHKVKSPWLTLDFEVKRHTEGRECYILGDVSDILAQLEECNVSLVAVRASRCAARLIRMVVALHDKLQCDNLYTAGHDQDMKADILSTTWASNSGEPANIAL